MFTILFTILLSFPLYANDGVVLFDYEGNILSTNKAFLEMYGIEDIHKMSMKNVCRSPFDAVLKPNHILRGYPLLDVIQEPEIRELITNIFTMREKGKVKIDYKGNLTIITSSFQGSRGRLFIGELIFRNMNPVHLQSKTEKRIENLDDSISIIKYHLISSNPENQTIHIQGKKVELDGGEFRLVHSLIKKPSEVISKQQSLDLINKSNNLRTKVEEGQFDEFILSLKEKLGQAGNYIQIIPNVGVMIDAENTSNTKTTSIKLYDLAIYLKNKKVFEANKAIELNNEEYETLLLLTRLNGYIFTPLQLAQNIQKDISNITNSREVHSVLSSLKRKLPKTARLIQIISGQGYCIKSASNSSPCKKVIGYERIFINPDSREVFHNGRELDINRTEFEILYYLIKNQKTDVSLNQIHQNIYNGNHNLNSGNILTSVKSLNQKIQEEEMNYIQKVSRKGYRLQKGIIKENDINDIDDIEDIIDLGPMVFNLNDSTIFFQRENTSISISNPTTYKILYLLARNPEKIIPYPQISIQLESEFNVIEKRIYSHIIHIRSKYPILNKHIQDIKDKGLRLMVNRKDIIHIGELTLNLSNFIVSTRNGNIILSPALFEFFYFLANNPDKTYTQMQILDGMYGKGHGLIERTIYFYLSNLRKKHPELGNYIQTYRNKEYRFKQKHIEDIIVGPMVFNLNDSTIFFQRENTSISISNPITYKILYLLTKNPEKMIPYSQISNQLESEFNVIEKNIYAHINRIRTKYPILNEYIQVIKKKGLRLTVNHNDIIHIDELTLNPSNLVVSIRNENIILPRALFEFFYFLANNPDKAYTQMQILDDIYGEGHGFSGDVITSHVSNLRKRHPELGSYIQSYLHKRYRFKRKNIQKIIELPDLIINPSQMEIIVNDQNILVDSEINMQLLYLLASNLGKEVNFSQITNALYDTPDSVNHKTIIRHIKNVRNIIGDDYQIKYIQNKGYRLQRETIDKKHFKEIINLGDVVFYPKDSSIFFQKEDVIISIPSPIIYEILYRLAEKNGAIIPYSQLINDINSEHNLYLNESSIYSRFKNIRYEFPIIGHYTQVIPSKGLRFVTDNSKDIIQIDEVTLNPFNLVVSIAGEEMTLFRSSFELIYFLAENPGKTYSQMQILDGIYGKGHGLTENTVNARVRDIRKRFPILGNYIQVRIKEGYSFKTNNTQKIISLPNLTINPNRMEVIVNDHKIIISSAVKMQLLHLLASNPRKEFSIPQITHILYGSSDKVRPQLISRYIVWAREIIGSDYQIILTKRGYRFQPSTTSSTFTHKEIITLQNMTVDLNNNQVFVDGKDTGLTAFEFDFLHLLANSPNKTFSLEQITDHLYKKEYTQDNKLRINKTIRQHLTRIRRKIKDAISFIQTVTGVDQEGYSLSNKEIIRLPEYDMIIDPNRLNVTIGNKKTTFSYVVFTIFNLFLENSSSVVTPHQFTDALNMEYSDHYYQSITKYQIHTLRSELKKMGFNDCISTVIRKGYLLDPNCFKK